MSRAEFWYVFGLAALALIAMRLKAIRHAGQDPMSLAFTLCIFCPALGVLTKQPFIAVRLDDLWGQNSSWLLADIFFIVGMCAGTYWIDMGTHVNQIRTYDWRLLIRWRLVILIAVIVWMGVAAKLEAERWALVERGGINVAGSWILVSGRLVYFGYSIWSLAYLSRGFYIFRQQLIDRGLYIRLWLPWGAVTLAIAAPILQILGTGYVFVRPEVLNNIWPPLWYLITVVQLGVAILVLSSFFGPAYRALIWLDKQILFRRLLRGRRLISQNPAHIIPLTVTPPASDFIIQDVDLWLARMVNEIESSKRGKMGAEIQSPAGWIMPTRTKEALKQEQIQFSRLLMDQPASLYWVRGDFYTLAWWYTAALNV